MDSRAEPTKEPQEMSTQDAVVAEVSIQQEEPTQPPEKWVKLHFTWAGKQFDLELAYSDRVFDLKAALETLTTVPGERQKILGLVKGKLPPDQATIASLSLATGKKFQLIGTPQGGEIKDPSLVDLPDVFNDLDVDLVDNPRAAALYKNDRRNIRKVKQATEALNIDMIEPFRPGKKLLVLDLDYTILDTKPLTSGSLPPSECARPGLHEFLEAVYLHYDIAIWSQTSWIWLETKLVELGMVGGDKNYKISFVLDKTCMFTVFSERDGKPWSHSVKALQIIWNKFPQFSAKNTIHIDDLSRNFALNPREGLKISAFKGANTPAALADRELEKLRFYLAYISTTDDLRKFYHHDWKKTIGRFMPKTLRDKPPPPPPAAGPATGPPAS